MTNYWVKTDGKTKVFHDTASCSMVRHYPKAYTQVSSSHPPKGLRQCRRCPH